MLPKYFVGVDLHKSVIQVCVLDCNGAVVIERRFTGASLKSGLEAVSFIAGYRRARVAVEALGLNRWFVTALRDRKIDVLVADPVKLDLKKLGKKTDRRDALEIARRLYLRDLDRYAHTYFPSDDEYGVRKVLRTRHKLVSIRQQVVNQIRATLNAYRIQHPSSALYAKRTLAELRRITHVNGNLRLCLQVLIDALEAIQAKVLELTERIRAAAEASHVSPLTDIPGVGPQTALTLSAELGDVSRFQSARHAASYAGLVPRVILSAKDTGHHGRITRRGNRELRWALSEWAVRLLASNELARNWARPRLQRMHRNKVRMALARRLLVGVYVTLRTGQEFSLDRCLAA